MESVWSVSKLSTESVDSDVFTPPTRRNSTVSSHRRCVLGITFSSALMLLIEHWALSIGRVKVLSVDSQRFILGIGLTWSDCGILGQLNRTSQCVCAL